MRKEIIILTALILVIAVPIALAQGTHMGTGSIKLISPNPTATVQASNTTATVQMNISQAFTREVVTNFVKCIKSQLAQGKTKQEAINACRPKKPSKIQLMNRCQIIRSELKNISEKISDNPSLINKYWPVILRLRSEYRHCIIVRPNGPALPSDKCQQYQIFKGILEEDEKKFNYLEYLAETGELNKTTLERYKLKLELFKERVQKLKEMCDRHVIEPPCKELYALTKVRDHLVQLEQVSNDTEAAKLNETIKKMDARIAELKDKCVKIPVVQQASEADNVEDASDIYNARLSRILENATLENMNETEFVKQLKAIQAERKELIREFVKKMHELNLERQNLIHRVIINRTVNADGVQTNVSKITVVIGNQTVTIQPGSKIKISVSNETAEADMTLEWVNGSLVDPETNKTIKILPTHIKKRLRNEKIRKIALKRLKNRPVYVVNSEKQGRLLGFIPVRIQVTHDVDPTTGNIEVTVKPWWGFLVR